MDQSVLARADHEGQAIAIERARSSPANPTPAWRAGHGHALKVLRLAVGMSLRQLAEHVGVSHALIGDWEEGRCYPRREDLMRVADLYEVPYPILAVLGLPTVGQTRDPVAAADPWAVE